MRVPPVAGPLRGPPAIGSALREPPGELRGRLGPPERVLLQARHHDRLKVGGNVDINTKTLDNDMIVTLPVSRNLPWYAAYSAIATGPLIGAGVWLAQKVFETQIDQMSSAKYKITGTVDAPVIEFVSIFSDSVRETPASMEPAKAGGSE